MNEEERIGGRKKKAEKRRRRTTVALKGGRPDEKNLGVTMAEEGQTACLGAVEKKQTGTLTDHLTKSDPIAEPSRKKG